MGIYSYEYVVRYPFESRIDVNFSDEHKYEYESALWEKTALGHNGSRGQRLPLVTSILSNAKIKRRNRKKIGMLAIQTSLVLSQFYTKLSFLNPD